MRDFVGNKAKKMNLKADVSRKQSTPKFSEKRTFLPPETPDHIHDVISKPH